MIDEESTVATSTPMIRLKVGITKVVSVVSVIAVMSGCSSVISNSERFYKDQPQRPINYREYLSN